MAMISGHSRVLASGVNFEEFVNAPEFYGRRLELVKGSVIEKAPGSLKESYLVVFLTALLGTATETVGGRLLISPFVMRLKEQMRSPNIIYIAPENEGRLLHNYLDGPADLAIEVVSRGSEAVDRGDKFEEYEAGGVREYWLLDPQRQEALFYIRDQDGLFRPAILEEGVFTSQVLPAVRLRVEWLWNQPPIMEILRGWNLV